MQSQDHVLKNVYFHYIISNSIFKRNIRGPKNGPFLESILHLFVRPLHISFTLIDCFNVFFQNITRIYFLQLQHFRFGARVSNNLYCYNAFTKYSYHPYNVELISKSPLILLYHNFTSETESNHLIKHVLPNVSPSLY